jgi:hypothetical protein
MNILENLSIVMRYKEQYIRPVVTDSMELALENAILGASLVDDLNSVKTAGQEVDDMNMSSEGFNSSWEE